MAKQTGVITFEGTLDNVTFYKTADGMLIRKKGSVSRKRLLTDPSFIRARENAAEFGNCAKCGGTLRKAVAVLVNKAKDRQLSSRMVTLFFQIKALDGINSRGKRTAAQGLETSMGKDLLRGFDFNVNAKLHTVLYAPYVLDPLTGSVTFTNFKPQEHLNCPMGATHFSLQSAVAVIDFGSGSSELSSSAIVNGSIGTTLPTAVLLPAALPLGTGVTIHLLLVEFLQEVNGEQYPLHNGVYNSLHIIDVH